MLRAMTVLEKKVEKKKEENLYNMVLQATDEDQSVIEVTDFDLPQSSAKLNISFTRPDITIIKGVGPTVAEKLRGAGFDSIEHIARSSVSQLTSIQGIGQANAQRIVERARALLNHKYLDDYQESVTSLPQASTTPSEPRTAETEQDIIAEDLEEYEFLEEEMQEEGVSHPIPIYEPELVPLSSVRENPVPLHPTISEKMIREEKKMAIEKAMTTLQDLGYDPIKMVPSLRKIYSLVDLIALKTIPLNEVEELVLILPIKICPLKGTLQISKEMIKYIPFNCNASDGAIYKTLLNSSFTQLEECQVLIYEDLRQEGPLLSSLKRFHNLDISLKKTLFHRTLSFNSGNTQMKILVEPVLLSENTVGFLEKLIPFAYLKKTNLHIITSSDFSKLVPYLEKKYSLLEIHSTKDISLVSYEDAYTQLIKRMEFFSVPFIGFAGVLILLLTLKSFEMLSLLLNFGYALSGIYVIILVYLNIIFYKFKGDLQQEFSTPYHKRSINLDETSLVLISEEFTPEMMAQFVFETVGKHNSSKIIAQIEENHIEDRVSKTQFTARIKNESFFELEETDEEKASENEYVTKYSDFLED
ncbi:MAG: helix-hairpin-helix domain-containing protein [Promethearchaeota archaeon]